MSSWASLAVRRLAEGQRYPDEPAVRTVEATELVVLLPLLVVYYFAQRHLIGGIASFGLKG